MIKHFALKARGGIAPHILNLMTSWRCVVNITPRPLKTLQRDPVPLAPSSVSGLVPVVDGCLGEEKNCLTGSLVWHCYNVRKFWTSLFFGSFKDVDILGTYWHVFVIGVCLQQLIGVRAKLWGRNTGVNLHRVRWWMTTCVLFVGNLFAHRCPKLRSAGRIRPTHTLIRPAKTCSLR